MLYDSGNFSLPLRHDSPMRPDIEQTTLPADWSTPALGPRSAWPSSLRLTLAIMLNSPLASVLMWGPQRVMLFNQAYAALLGGKGLLPPGGKVPALMPAVWGWNRAALDAAWQGAASSFMACELPVWRDGLQVKKTLDLFYTPISDEAAGDAAGAGGTAVVRGVLCSLMPSVAAAKAAPARSFHVLVVEDNLDSQYLVCEMLRAFGHRVQAVADGETAAGKLLDEHFDLLFTDVGLPGMSGIELARGARRHQPRLKILFASGYGETVTRQLEFAALSLQKPYELDALEKVLNDISVQLQTDGM
jgi:CheY-like chemotaxis protein